MKKFLKISFTCTVNKVILVKLICIFVGGQDGDSDSSNDSNSSTASTATSLNWDDMNSAIDDFFREYESRHQAFASSDRKLTRMKTFEVGSMYYSYLLKFMACKKGEQCVYSSVVIKVPQRGENHEREERLQHYTKERYMYEYVLPIMYSFRPHATLSPEFYIFTKSNTLIIENLNESRFYPIKGTMKNVFGCAQVFKYLARFHALSIPYLDKVGSEAMDFLTVINGSERFRSDIGDHKGLLQNFRTYVKPHLSTVMQKTFEDMVSKVRIIIEHGYSSNANGFNVVLHGDPNRTNVFFSNAKKIYEKKCKFVDFHDSRIGSPAIDLINYLITSVQFELFAENGVTLIREYLDEFRRTKQALNFDGQMEYDVDEFLIDLRTYKMFFLYKLTFNALLYWNEPHSTAGSAVETDNYDFLWTSKSFVSTYKKWMQVILSW